jgi:hypothetical protein
MSGSEFCDCNRDEFLAEFYSDPVDKAAIAAGMEQLRAEQRAFRFAEMRRRLGTVQGARPPSSTPSQVPPNCATWPPTSSVLFSPIRIFSKGK